LFPVFSKLKKHQEKLSQVYIKISFYISFVSFPVLIGVAVTANLFVPIIFGEQWTDSVIVFQVYSISSLLLILTASVSTSLLYSVNKPDLVFYIDVVTNIIYFLSLLIFASQGLVAVLIVYSSYIVYKTLILQYFTNKQLTHSFIYYFYKLMPSAVMSLIMGGLVLILQCITNNVLPVVWQLVTCVMFGLIIYSMLVLAFSRSTIRDLVLIMTKGVVK
jgi:O-antigen/teichoic acid export membrane protein